MSSASAQRDGRRPRKHRPAGRAPPTEQPPPPQRKQTPEASGSKRGAQHVAGGGAAPPPHGLLNPPGAKRCITPLAGVKGSERPPPTRQSSAPRSPREQLPALVRGSASQYGYELPPPPPGWPMSQSPQTPNQKPTGAGNGRKGTLLVDVKGHSGAEERLAGSLEHLPGPSWVSTPESEASLPKSLSTRVRRSIKRWNPPKRPSAGMDRQPAMHP